MRAVVLRDGRLEVRETDDPAEQALAQATGK